MSFLIDQIDSSGLFAQSAYSASIATKDSNGNDITATYLTGVDLTPYQTIAGMTAYQTTSGMTGYATTGDISATEWNGAYNWTNTNSANLTGVSYQVNNNSARYDETINTVISNSASWGQQQSVTIYHDDTLAGSGTQSDWLRVTSAQQWTDCYNRVAAGSAYWPNQSMSSLFEATYGVTPYYDITQAINDKKVVYCRISPTGASRMAFLAYIGNNNVEFQYYRSVNSHTDSQQGDQVFVYTVDNTNTWTTTVRNAFTKVIAGTGLSSNYSNGASGKIELSLDGSFVGNYYTKTDTSSKQELNDAIGNVETLLASL